MAAKSWPASVHRLSLLSIARTVRPLRARAVVHALSSMDRLMKFVSLGRMIAAAFALAMTPAFSPSEALACACGCSVFDIGGVGNLPQEDDHGGRVFFDWYHAAQTKNWAGSSSANPALNNDKQIKTEWFAMGIQYMFNRDWGLMAKIPYADRAFTTDTTGLGDISRFRASVWGDLELQAMYTGLSKDMSTGLTFGVKLPTGDFKAPGFDRDTQIGTGSTDLLIGAFHRGMITGDNSWQYFSQVRWQLPVAYQNSANGDTYKPGQQVDAAAGLVYNNGYKWLGFDKVAPVLQLIGSHRERDQGTGALPADTGFDRLFISPGVEFSIVLDEANKRVLKIYGDVELPVYTRVNASDGAGQLVAPALYKLSASYNF